MNFNVDSPVGDFFTMKLQLFSFTSPYFSWTWKIDALEANRAVAEWMTANPGITVREIKHDTIPSFWYPPQFLISIYYEDAQ